LSKADALLRLPLFSGCANPGTDINAGQAGHEERHPHATPRPNISSISRTLTPSEIASLRRSSTEAGAYFRKAFEKYRPKKKV
jgi:hypothetical protein